MTYRELYKMFDSVTVEVNLIIYNHPEMENEQIGGNVGSIMLKMKTLTDNFFCGGLENAKQTDRN